MIVSNFHIILNAFQRQTYLLFDSAVHKWATPDVDCIYSRVRALTSVVKKQNPCGYSLYVMLHKSSCQFTISKGLSLEFAQIYQTCHFINFIILNIQYCCNIFIGEWLYQLYIYKNIQKFLKTLYIRQQQLNIRCMLLSLLFQIICFPGMVREFFDKGQNRHPIVKYLFNINLFCKVILRQNKCLLLVVFTL